MNQKQLAMMEFLTFPEPFQRVESYSDLDEAVHTISELGLWTDSVDSVSAQQAVECWKLVERLRSQRLPPALKT